MSECVKGECVIPLTLRPRRAEQVPSALDDGCDPAAGCKAPEIRVLMCAFTVASQKAGSLLHVPAHLSPGDGGEGMFY